MSVDDVVKLVEGEARQKEIEDAIRKDYMSPPGALGLPPLLEAKRQKELIPDFCFRFQAVYDRIVLVQLPPDDEEMWGNTGILKTRLRRSVDEKEAPRGVVISAGLTALDSLKAHGMDIGHTVYIVRMAPWSLEVGEVKGKEFRVLILRDGDIVASEELAQNFREGKCRVECKRIERDGIVQNEHYYVDENGDTFNPVAPFRSEDY